MEAAEILLQLGVKAKEIQELTLEATSSISGMDWFNQWIQATSAFASRDYTCAVTSLKKLEDTPLLRDDVGVLTNLGLAEHSLGNNTHIKINTERNICTYFLALFTYLQLM